MRKLHMTILVGIAAALLTATPARAALIDLTASMDCAQANAGVGTCGSGGSGTGTATVTLDTDTNTLSWLITWSGLAGTPTLMHFHGPALTNQNAGVQVSTGVAGGSPVVGAAVLSDPQKTDLLNELWYLNLHTDLFPAGEIRGQVLGVAGGCAPTPELSCIGAAQAKLDYNEKKAGKEKMKLQWKKLTDATAQGDFGDPVNGGTAVTLCIYNDADALVEELVVDRAGNQCAGQDCWKVKGTKGYGYKDKESSAVGVSKMGFKAGDAGKGKADAKGKNNSAKGQMSLPTGVFAKLTTNTTPTIQMVTSDGFCVGATMTNVKKDQDGHYSAERK